MSSREAALTVIFFLTRSTFSQLIGLVKLNKLSHYFAFFFFFSFGFLFFFFVVVVVVIVVVVVPLSLSLPLPLFTGVLPQQWLSPLTSHLARTGNN